MPFQVKLVSAGLGAGAAAEALGACACARAAAAARLTMSPHAPPTRVRPRARRPRNSFLLQDAFACFTVRSSLDSRVEEVNSPAAPFRARRDGQSDFRVSAGLSFLSCRPNQTHEQAKYSTRTGPTEVLPWPKVVDGGCHGAAMWSAILK